MPWLGRSIESLEQLDAVLIMGGNLRFEQPILAHRLRKAVVNKSARVSSINALSNQAHFDLHEDLVGSNEQQLADLVAIAKSCEVLTGQALPAKIQKLAEKAKASGQHKAIAQSLNDGEQSAIVVGIQALSSPYLSAIRSVCEYLAAASTSTLGYLSVSSNSAGACLAGAQPHRGVAGVAVESAGQNVVDMLSSSHSVLVTFGTNIDLDINSDQSAEAVGSKNHFVIAIDSFENSLNQNQADLVLPLAAFGETSGTFVNVEGLWQSFKGCVKASGEARQGWKILSALGQLLLPGEFNYSSSAQVKDLVKDQCREVGLNNLAGFKGSLKALPSSAKTLQANHIAPLYASDDLSRHAAPLQKTPIARKQAVAAINRAQASKLKLTDAEMVQVRIGDSAVVLPLSFDDSVANGCVCLPSGIDAVAGLSRATSNVELERVS